MTKMLRSTSISIMRFLLTFAVAVILLGLPGVSVAFACPFMMTATAEETPCSHCPGEKEESCPRSACLHICPYSVEKTAVVAEEAIPPPAVLPEVARSSILIAPPLVDRSRILTPAARDSDAHPLYLLNRVLLI